MYLKVPLETSDYFTIGTIGNFLDPPNGGLAGVFSPAPRLQAASGAALPKPSTDLFNVHCGDGFTLPKDAWLRILAYLSFTRDRLLYVDCLAEEHLLQQPHEPFQVCAMRYYASESTSTEASDDNSDFEEFLNYVGEPSLPHPPLDPSDSRRWAPGYSSPAIFSAAYFDIFLEKKHGSEYSESLPFVDYALFLKHGEWSLLAMASKAMYYIAQAFLHGYQRTYYLDALVPRDKVLLPGPLPQECSWSPLLWQGNVLTGIRALDRVLLLNAYWENRESLSNPDVRHEVMRRQTVKGCPDDETLSNPDVRREVILRQQGSNMASTTRASLRCLQARERVAYRLQLKGNYI